MHIYLLNQQSTLIYLYLTEWLIHSFETDSSQWTESMSLMIQIHSKKKSQSESKSV